MTEKNDASDRTSWPQQTEDATADRLIVHAARITIALHENSHVLYTAVPWDNDKADPERRAAIVRYVDTVSAMVNSAQVGIALAEVQKRSRADADALALRIWELTEDGGALTELAWEHLDDRGVDPAEITRLARESATAKTETEAAK